MNAALILLALAELPDPAAMAAEDCRRAGHCQMSGEDLVAPAAAEIGDCFTTCPRPPLLPPRADLRAEIIAAGEALQI